LHRYGSSFGGVSSAELALRHGAAYHLHHLWPNMFESFPWRLTDEGVHVTKKVIIHWFMDGTTTPYLYMHQPDIPYNFSVIQGINVQDIIDFKKLCSK
jgi:hypothetical protein